MLYRSLVLGVLFGVGVFAVKSGVGLAYAVSRRKRLRRKVGILLCFSLLYALAFVLIHLLLQRVDPVRHLPAIQRFLQSGMLVHLTMAALMAVWGLVLLKRSGDQTGASRGWLMLVLPCPVCAAVILFSTAFFVSLFPEDCLWVSVGLCLTFLLLSFLTFGIVSQHRGLAARSPEAFLGGAMMLTAAYFVLSVTVMPQFADLDSVYRLARNRTGAAEGNLKQVALMAITAGSFFGAGFTAKTRRIRSQT